MHEVTDEDDEWLQESLLAFSLSPEPTLRDEIAARCDWLAVRGARRFASRGEPFDDLLQVARIGLIKAIARFDPKNGAHFSAYATPTIMGEIRRYFRDHTWDLHVSRRIKDLRPSVQSVTEQLTTDLGRPPLVSEIAASLEISEDSVLETMEAGNAYRSVTLDPAGSSQLYASDNDFEEMINRDLIVQVLDQLPVRQRKILYLRFFEERTQAEIAAEIGTSQVHVSRLIASSLLNLRSLISEDAVTV